MLNREACRGEAGHRQAGCARAASELSPDRCRPIFLLLSRTLHVSTHKNAQRIHYEVICWTTQKSRRKSRVNIFNIGLDRENQKEISVLSALGFGASTL